MAGPVIPIEPPVREARVGGISDVATFRPNERIGHGAEKLVFQSDGCTFPQVAEHLCYTDTADDPADKTFSGIEILDAVGQPFPLYGAVRCVAGPDPDEMARARAILDEGQDRALEDALEVFAAGGTALAAGGSIEGAIARVEQALDSEYRGRGVLAMSRFDVVLAVSKGVVTFEGGKFVSAAGTPVLASGRFAPGTVYGLGAIVVEHTSVLEREAFNTTNNYIYALAEAVFAIAVDCRYRVKSTTTA